MGLPQLREYRGVENDNRIFRHHQAIIPSYKFTCCGNITEWGADVFLNDQNAYTLDFQVWRPSPTVEDSTGAGCYSLVGNNRFTSISLSGGVARVTPSPQNYIQFQPNDVLGFYVESANLVTFRPPNGLVLQIQPVLFTSEVVWHASIAPSIAASQNRDCPYAAGSNGILNTLTRAAPVISIGTGIILSLFLSLSQFYPISFFFTIQQHIHVAHIPHQSSHQYIQTYCPFIPILNLQILWILTRYQMHKFHGCLLEVLWQVWY